LRSKIAFDFTDPAFIRPYWRARLTFAQTTDGFEHRLSIAQPFYSVMTPRSAEVSFDNRRLSERIFHAGGVRSRFGHDHRQFVAAYGIATNVSNASATRWTFGFRGIDDTFRDPAVADRTFRYVFLRVNRVNDDYISWKWVDNDIRDQDFNLGRQLSLETAVSPASRTTEFVAATVAQGRRIGDDSFALANAEFQTRLDRGIRNGILSGCLRYVRRFDTTRPQTFLARVMFNHGWNVDPETQFFADAAAGLRGYRLFAFEGSRNVVMNFEHRMYAGREILHVVSPSFAAFVDGGKATNGVLMRPGSFKTDVGIGLRLGLPRAPRNVLRVDFAYPLQRDFLGRRGMLISFSSGQAF
jgi:hypothetical protein